MGRRLLYHAESDSYIEVASIDEANEIYGSSLDGELCCDVTNDPWHEKNFKHKK